MTHSFLNFDIQTNRDLLAKVLSDCSVQYVGPPVLYILSASINTVCTVLKLSYVYVYSHFPGKLKCQTKK